MMRISYSNLVMISTHFAVQQLRVNSFLGLTRRTAGNVKWRFAFNHLIRCDMSSDVGNFYTHGIPLDTTGEPVEKVVKQYTNQSFSSLGASPELVHALSLNNFYEATEVQARSFEHVLSGKNMIIGAETGSGKTFSYMIPIIHQLINDYPVDTRKQFPSYLIMVPNKELARQVVTMSNSILSNINIEEKPIKIDTAKDVGTVNWRNWPYGPGQCPDILVCTPRFLTAFLPSSNLVNVELYRNMRTLVLDEADMLMEGSYLKDMDKVFDSIKLTRRAMIRTGDIDINSELVQVVLSAATIPSYGLKSIQASIQQRFPNAIEVKTENMHQHHPSITQKFIKVSSSASQSFNELSELVLQEIQELQNSIQENIPTPEISTTVSSEPITENKVEISIDTFLEEEEEEIILNPKYMGINSVNYSIMIFLNTAQKAKDFAHILNKKWGIKTAQFHNLLFPSEKEENLQKFRQGEIKILICTDSAARGFDLPIVKHVIQAEFALNVVQHLHRIGRASRGGRQGFSSNFYGPTSEELVSRMTGGINGEVSEKIEGLKQKKGSKQNIESSFSRRRGFRQKIKKQSRKSGF